ncbi:MAG: hypothetical protein M1819_000825 [Sarea resinae]|nr:MAG: hypothetical protein M1819_000825 [Sarea resinae]
MISWLTGRDVPWIQPWIHECREDRSCLAARESKRALERVRSRGLGSSRLRRSLFGHDAALQLNHLHRPPNGYGESSDAKQHTWPDHHQPIQVIHILSASKPWQGERSVPVVEANGTTPTDLPPQPAFTVMASFKAFLVVYFLGGLTFIPLLFAVVLLHAYLTFPTYQPPTKSTPDELKQPEDDEDAIESGPHLEEKFKLTSHEPDVAAGYFSVCREWVPGGVNGKPPERTTPAGSVVATESPSVYQSMYRSLFDRNKTPATDNGRGAGNHVKKGRNVFFVVLRHGHLMLYDDSEQIEVRHVISLAHHDVELYSGGGDIPEGELWIKRNAIRLSRKNAVGDLNTMSKPFYLFSDNCSDKEDFYFALIQNQDRKAHDPENLPLPQTFETKHLVDLVKRLHSSEEQLQTRWLNALVGRLFLALYKTSQVENFIRTKITKKIARVKKPAFLSDIVIRKIEMGEGAPYITNPRLKDLTVDGNCCVEADIDYTGNFRLEIGTTARIELGSRFKPRQVNLVLAVVLKRLRGHALVRFKPPPSNRIWLTFETIPTIEMSVEPIVSSRQITYGFILRAIESRIREVVAETLVLPHWDDSPFTSTIGQAFRGGIWANEQPPRPAEDPLTRAAESGAANEVEKEESDNIGATLKDALANNEKTASMPTLSSSAGSSVTARKPTASAVPPAETNGAVSSGVQTHTPPAIPPRAMRSHSFATAATPIVSMDTTSAGAVKDQARGDQSNATSAMIAIRNRSQPASPMGSPMSSPPKPALLSETSRNASYSFPLAQDESSADEVDTQSSGQLPEQSSFSSSLASFNGSSGGSISTHGLDGSHNVQNHLTPDTASIAEKRRSLASLGSAANTAKKWGWNVLNRNTNQRANAGDWEEEERMGTPEHPIGRGRPLPPPGTPLPPPEKNASRTSIRSLPKRKPVPPSRNGEKAKRPVPPPPLPIRKARNAREAERDNYQGMLVVEAPPESEPSSPMFGSPNDSGEALTVEDAPASDAASASTNSSETPEAHPASELGAVPTEAANSSIPVWEAAQEEEERIKSAWIDAENEHL